MKNETNGRQTVRYVVHHFVSLNYCSGWEDALFDTLEEAEKFARSCLYSAEIYKRTEELIK